MCVISQTSWRSDRTWQRTQRGAVLLLSGAGSRLGRKHPARWLDEPPTERWYRQSTTAALSSKPSESIKSGHSRKYKRNMLKNCRKSSVFLLLHSLQTLPTLSTKKSCELNLPYDSWLLSKVSGSRAFTTATTLQAFGPGGRRLFPKLEEGKHQKWWVKC